MALRILGFDPRKEVIRDLIDAYAAKQGKDEGKFNLAPEWFMEIVEAELNQASERKVFRRAFRFMDEGKKGFLNRGDLRRIADELGIALTNEDLDEMLAEAGANEEGKLKLKDFLAFAVEN